MLFYNHVSFLSVIIIAFYADIWRLFKKSDCSMITFMTIVWLFLKLIYYGILRQCRV
nr:MAG TPA: hypothetical protein [Caudoviricetes sp.]